jgi:hypothetical protein
MSAGLTSTLMLDIAASHGDDQLRGARERAQAADVRRTRAARRLFFRSR